MERSILSSDSRLQMKFYLGVESKDGYKNLGCNSSEINKAILDAEAMEIYSDKFLSRFNFFEVPKVLELLIRKIRRGGTLTICDTDFDLIARTIFRQEASLEAINRHIFSDGIIAKSMLNFEFIKDLLPDNFQIINTHFQQDTFLLRARRIK